MATQNTVGPSDGNGPSLGNVDFEGLGLEKEMVKGLKSAYDYVEKILKVMEKVEKSSGKVGKNISGKGGNSQNIGLGEIRTGFSSMGATCLYCRYGRCSCRTNCYEYGAKYYGGS
jgi:hypothetical protein